VRRALLLATLLTALLVSPAPALAQENARPRVEIELPPLESVTTQGPLVHARAMLSERRVREALRNGFPVRLNFRVELWSTEGWFNSLVSRTDWELIVRRDGLEETYLVNRVFGDGRREQRGPFATVSEAEAEVAQGMRVPLTPSRRRERYYYNVVCEVELLSVSDLDELERWLRGEAGPAVRGERNPGTALTRGLRTLFVRLLGGDGNRYEARTVTFFVS
jgi:hypothetical protein